MWNVYQDYSRFIYLLINLKPTKLFKKCVRKSVLFFSTSWLIEKKANRLLNLKSGTLPRALKLVKTFLWEIFIFLLILKITEWLSDWWIKMDGTYVSLLKLKLNLCGRYQETCEKNSIVATKTISTKSLNMNLSHNIFSTCFAISNVVKMIINRNDL